MCDKLKSNELILSVIGYKIGGQFIVKEVAAATKEKFNSYIFRMPRSFAMELLSPNEITHLRSLEMLTALPLETAGHIPYHKLRAVFDELLAGVECVFIKGSRDHEKIIEELASHNITICNLARLPGLIFQYKLRPPSCFGHINEEGFVCAANNVLDICHWCRIGLVRAELWPKDNNYELMYESVL